MDDLTPFETPLALPTTPGLTLRLLRAEEYPKLARVPGPFHGQQLAQTDSCRVAVAEQDGVIIAYWVISLVVHLDPLFIADDFRHHPKLALGLLGLVVSVLQTLGATYAYAIIANGDQPANGTLAEKMGLTPVPGTLYGGPIPSPGDA